MFFFFYFIMRQGCPETGKIGGDVKIFGSKGMIRNFFKDFLKFLESFFQFFKTFCKAFQNFRKLITKKKEVLNYFRGAKSSSLLSSLSEHPCNMKYVIIRSNDLMFVFIIYMMMSIAYD